MGGLFEVPKPDAQATLLQQQQLEAQTKALDEQRAANATREAEAAKKETATKRARAAGGRHLLLNDEVGVPPMQKNLGA